MYVFANATLPQAGLPGIRHTTLASADSGTHHLSVWRQTIDAGQATPPHRHGCEEVVMVMSGHGHLHIDGGVVEFGPDSTLVLPAGIDHQIVNSGDAPLDLIAAFAMTPVPTVALDGSDMPLPWKT